MLYGSHYEAGFSTRKQELEYQRALAEKLLQWALLKEYGVSLSALHRERTSAGKPFFVDCPIHFSLSHCRGMVCCALSSDSVGVDVEQVRPVRPAIVRRVCTEEERLWLSVQRDQTDAFFSLWTLKESVMKLSGQGIRYGFQQASFTFKQDTPCFREPEVLLSQFALSGGWKVSAASRKERFTNICLIDLP